MPFSEVSQPGETCQVDELAVPAVEIECVGFQSAYRRGAGSEDEIEVAVVIDVSHIASHGPVGVDKPGFFRNVIERAILLCKTNEISMEELPNVFHSNHSFSGSTLPGIKMEGP